MKHHILLGLPLVLLSAGVLSAADAPWRRHTIDDSSRGADGVRVADVNGDGLPDFTTGWEEGGRVRVYLNPGHAHVKDAWPAVTVGKVKSPEDAVFADLDGDGAVDVVSSCEGNTQSVFVHWAPVKPDDYLAESAWTTESIPTLAKKTRWMFCLPMQVDGERGIDLVIGSKEPNATIGWLESPRNPRDLAAWIWHPLYDAGWVMSLEAVDVNGDGRLDVLASDRKGRNRGVLVLEHPGNDKAGKTWPIRRIGGAKHEVMFLDYRDLPAPGWRILVATRDNGVLGFFPGENSRTEWSEAAVPAAENTGTLKSARWADIDLDGRLDIVYSCENATGNKSGVVWLKAGQGDESGKWLRHEISGPEGVKFDLIQMLDLDADGDLDVVTCEERANLGVIWYENPAK